MGLHYFIAALALCLSAGLYAQKQQIPAYNPAKVTNGEYLKLRRSNTAVAAQVLALDGNFYYVCPTFKTSFTNFNYGIYAAKIDPELKVQTPRKQMQEILFEVNGEKATNTRTLVFGGKICAFNFVYDRKADTKTLYLQEIDKQNLIPSRNAKQVAQVTEAKFRNNSGSFDFVLSRDKSKLLIRADMPRKRKDNATYGLTVLNDKLDIVWSKSVEMPYEENLFEMQDFEVDQDGNAYLVAKLYKEKRKEKANGSPNYAYLILKYNQNGEQVGSKLIELSNKYVRQLSLYAGDADKLRCVGFYSFGASAAAKGVFYLSLDSTLSITKETYKDLSVDDISSADGQDRGFFGGAISDLSLGGFLFRSVVGKPDGGLQMVAEQHWITSTAVRDNKGRVVSYQYYSNFGALVIIDLSPAGDINWVSFIKKYEIASGFDYAPRHFLVPTEQGLRFFINDHRSNYDPKRRNPRGISWSNYKRKGLISAVLIDPQGRQTREELRMDKQNKGFLIPYAGYWDGQKEVVLPFYKSRKLRLDRLQLP